MKLELPTTLFGPTRLLVAELHFQQKVALNGSFRVDGYEALIRGRTLNGQILSPKAILGAIVAQSEVEAAVAHRQIAIAIFHHAIKAAKVLRTNVAINVEPGVLADRTFLRAIEEHQFTEYPVTIEMIETPSPVSMAKLIEAVRFTQDMGHRVAIDDFGIANANIFRLTCVAANEVKIDASMLNHQRGKILLPHVVRAAHDLGATVCIEGVETMAHHEVAQSSGADAAQGFLYSLPSPIKGFEQMSGLTERI